MQSAFAAHFYCWWCHILGEQMAVVEYQGVFHIMHWSEPVKYRHFSAAIGRARASLLTQGLWGQGEEDERG